MKRRITTLVACLGLLVTSAWLVTNPAWAGSYTINCADGSTRTCSGSNCQGNDDTSTQRGYCTCGTPGGTPDSKECPARGGGGTEIAIEEGPVS
jgi:hypothetical protein